MVFLTLSDCVCLFRALARNCKAPLDDKKGSDSKENWQQGKPVRVVRSCKGRKHSEYAPEEGNRYDGIYKVSVYAQPRPGDIELYLVLGI
jgi:hypothetical protein